MYSAEAINTFAEVLSRDDVRIIAHKNPDGDTLGSCFALCSVLKQRGKHAEVVCGDTVPCRLSVITDGLTELKPTFRPDYIVTVDIATTELMGSDYSDIKVDCAIDHHYTNTKYAKKTILDGNCSSAGELLYRLLSQSKIEISRYTAEKLYVAIASDTGCFKFSNTTPETHETAARLLGCGFDFGDLNRRLFDEADVRILRFESELINNMRLYENGRVVFFFITRDIMSKYEVDDSETDGISYLLRRIKGAEVGATLREVPDGKTRVSLRSFGNADVSRTAQVFGGGGHIRAAGCTLDGNIYDAAEKVLKEIKL